MNGPRLLSRASILFSLLLRQVQLHRPFFGINHIYIRKKAFFCQKKFPKMKLYRQRLDSSKELLRCSFLVRKYFHCGFRSKGLFYQEEERTQSGHCVFVRWAEETATKQNHFSGPAHIYFHYHHQNI